MLYPKQRRLQRPPDFTGARLDAFRQVVLRHGLPGAVLAGLLLLAPGMPGLLADSLAPARVDPTRYGLTAAAIFGLLAAYASWLARGPLLNRLGWILYLAGLSAWEEWVFRLALPQLLEHELGFRYAVLFSNALFGTAHYFTLRWQWPWCVAAFLGGLALSGRLEAHGNLWLIIGLHWVATVVNTPIAPQRNT